MSQQVVTLCPVNPGREGRLGPLRLILLASTVAQSILETVADLGKNCIELGPDNLNGGNADHGNQRCNQTILDHRDAFFLRQEGFAEMNELLHVKLLY